MAEEYIIVPQGAKNMTHEDIIFIRDIILKPLYTVRLVHGDQEVERGLNHWFWWIPSLSDNGVINGGNHTTLICTQARS